MRAWGSELASESGNQFRVGTTRTLAGQCEFRFIELCANYEGQGDESELAGQNRLGNESASAGGRCLRTRAGIVMAGDKNDRCLTVGNSLVDLFARDESIDARHDDVEKDKVEGF